MHALSMILLIDWKSLHW